MSTNRRLELHEKLCEILGSRNVYFMPPPSKKMTFPCFVYEKSPKVILHADNKPYYTNQPYQIIYIDNNPDTTVPDEMLEEFQYCMSERSYVNNGMYYYPHRVFF